MSSVSSSGSDSICTMFPVTCTAALPETASTQTPLLTKCFSTQQSRSLLMLRRATTDVVLSSSADTVSVAAAFLFAPAAMHAPLSRSSTPGGTVHSWG